MLVSMIKVDFLFVVTFSAFDNHLREQEILLSFFVSMSSEITQFI